MEAESQDNTEAESPQDVCDVPDEVAFLTETGDDVGQCFFT
jgi:hypothetical protein